MHAKVQMLMHLQQSLAADYRVEFLNITHVQVF